MHAYEYKHVHLCMYLRVCILVKVTGHMCANCACTYILGASMQTCIVSTGAKMCICIFVCVCYLLV